ncbi:hypothetical protein GCM10009642_45470 [Nocardiopsis metallicus]
MTGHVQEAAGDVAGGDPHAADRREGERGDEEAGDHADDHQLADSLKQCPLTHPIRLSDRERVKAVRSVTDGALWR